MFLVRTPFPHECATPRRGVKSCDFEYQLLQSSVSPSSMVGLLGVSVAVGHIFKNGCLIFECNAVICGACLWCTYTWPILWHHIGITMTLDVDVRKKHCILTCNKTIGFSECRGLHIDQYSILIITLKYKRLGQRPILWVILLYIILV